MDQQSGLGKIRTNLSCFRMILLLKFVGNKASIVRASSINLVRTRASKIMPLKRITDIILPETYYIKQECVYTK